MSAEYKLYLGQACLVRRHWNLLSLQQHLAQTCLHKMPANRRKFRSLIHTTQQNSKFLTLVIALTETKAVEVFPHSEISMGSAVYLRGTLNGFKVIPQK